MSDWWYVIAVVAVVAVGVQYLRRRMTDNVNLGGDRPGGAFANRDYMQEREDDRVAQMSEDDRAWEAASLQRNRETQERVDTRFEQRA